MAFAVQKVGELATLATGLAEGGGRSPQLDANDRASRRPPRFASNSHPDVRARSRP